jgi:20S proteasome alpha/beta subunit
VLKTGTSTVGITFNGGAVVGADHRATMGHFVANKSVQKLFRIGDNLGLTTAGLVGHAQSLSRTLAAEVALYELRRGQQMTVKGAATLTANILSGNRTGCSCSSSVWTPMVQPCTQSIRPGAPSPTSTARQALARRTCTVSLRTGSATA